MTRSATSLLFVLLLVSFNSFAQLFPVQASLQIIPPNSPYLSDYTIPGSQKLMVQLIANDITISDHPIKFRFTIEGLGITIRTKPTIIPTSHTLNGGGAPTLLYGEDLIEYFHPNNLDFAGISRRDYEKTGKLPEGVYRFMLEVVDYHRNVVLSNRAMTVVWIVLNDPPLLNLPRNHAKVSIIDPTNIPFTWTPRHSGSPNAAYTTEYLFKLVELPPSSPERAGEEVRANNQQPSTNNQTLANQTLANQAILSQPPIFETTLTQSQFVYGPAEPALIPGRKYAWQVQARDEEGRDIFKNQGKSEVYVFQFGDVLGVPENLRFEGGNDVTLTIRWEPAMNGEMPDTYNIRYKPVTGDTWYEMLSGELRFATIANLKPNTEYVVQVRAKKDKTYSDYTSPLRVKTTEKKDTDFNCGTPPVVSDPVNQTPIANLVPGDVITNDDWRVVITEVTKTANGIYQGKGLMAVKLFNGASIKVTFSGGVNTDYQMISGGVRTVYNRGSAMSTVVDEMQKIGEKKKEAEKEKKDSIVVPVPIVVVGTIDSVYFDKDKKEIVVIDTDGKKTTYAQPVNAVTKEPIPAQLTDAAGNTVVVAKDGKVKKGTSTASTGQIVSVKGDPIKNRIVVLILEKFETEIGAWLRINGKGGEEDEDVYLAEELPSCFPKNANIIKHINESTIPYFKAHPEQIVTILENNPDTRQVFDKTSKLFSDANAVDLKKVNETENETLEKGTCIFIVDADVQALETELAEKIGNDKKESNCFGEAWKRGRQVYGRYDFNTALYAGFIRYLLCETEKENCGMNSSTAAFSCGLTNGFLQEVDWVALLEIDLDLEEVLLCIAKSIPIGGRREDNPDLDKVLFRCITGAELGDLIKGIKEFVVANWTEPYYQGQATAFTLTLLSPFKSKIVAKLKTLSQYESKISKLEKLATAKNADELVDLSKSLAGGTSKVLDDIILAMKKDFPSSWKFNKVGDDLFEVVDSKGIKWATVTSDKITAPGRTAVGTPGNPILNKVPLVKNMIYEVDGFIYTTDDLGRVLKTNADLDDVVRVRLGNQQIRSIDVKDGVRGVDQGGHIVGSRFFGPGEQINLYPQSANLNQGAWKQMENSWADAMSKGKDVKIEVEAYFNGDSPRPANFKVKYTIDGQPFQETFINQ